MIIKIESEIESKSSLKKLKKYIVNPKSSNVNKEGENVLGRNERITHAFTNDNILTNIEEAKEVFDRKEEKMISDFERYEKQQKRKNRKVAKKRAVHLEISPALSDWIKEDGTKRTPVEMWFMTQEVLRNTFEDFDEKEIIAGFHMDTEKPHFHVVIPTIAKVEGKYKLDKMWQIKKRLRTETEKIEKKYNLTLTGENKLDDNPIPDSDFDYVAKNMQFGNQKAVDVIEKARGELMVAVDNNNKLAEDKACNDIERVEGIVNKSKRKQEKLNFFTIENAMRKIYTNDKSIFDLEEKLAENNIEMKLSFKPNGEVKGITYHLIDTNGKPVKYKKTIDGKVIDSPVVMSATALTKKLKGKSAIKNRFTKNGLADLDGWFEYLEAQRFLQNKQYKPKSHSYRFGGGQPFKIKPLTVYDHKFKPDMSIFFDFTSEDKRPICEQNKETGQISMLGDPTKENSKKSMELCKDWKNISITSNSSQWLGYELNSWLTLDSDPKKSIKDFKINKKSQCQNISFKDFAEATKGMQFTKEEMKHIKENLLSTADAIKHGNELDKLLVAEKPQEPTQEHKEAIEVAPQQQIEEMEKALLNEITEPEQSQEQQSNEVEPVLKTPEEMLAELNSKLNGLKGAKTADIELDKENLHLMNDYADGKKTLTELYFSASNRDRLSLTALKRKSAKAKNGELNVSKYRIS
ncbi:hypothetical protein QTO12_04540 [Vibrio owensii]|uniref:MobA/VirD2-like nuclease domain-containing protein n=1 Tax=Vibrio parahaemolyticus TaxID=670 RepID=A0A9Q3YHC1_VIBPH|nr:hypothetical protein [Vibrio parahaemolyticus]MCC3803442.1 hypothetical protein [Vibrio parahaemolyticus]MCR9779358.1 hypothetical protein [Vibrio parahaemolyticus]